MAVPVVLRAVDGQVHVHVRGLHPHIADDVDVHQILLGAGAVDDVDMAVVRAVGEHVLDDAAQRREADAAGDKDQILAL